jgi:hypothetical protein
MYDAWQTAFEFAAEIGTDAVVRCRKLGISNDRALRSGELHGKEAVMRRILVDDDDPHVGRAIQG